MALKSKPVMDGTVFDQIFRKELIARVPEGTSVMSHLVRVDEKLWKLDTIGKRSDNEEEFKSLTWHLQKRQTDYKDRLRIFKKSIIRFSSFVEENDVRRQKALKKFELEEEAVRKLTLELAKQREEKERLEKRLQWLKEQVVGHRVYLDYLRSVAKAGGFRDCSAVMCRYDTLVLGVTQRKRASSLDKITSLRSRLQQLLDDLREQQKDENLQLSEVITELRHKLSLAQGKVRDCVQPLEDAESASAHRTSLQWRLKMAVDYMYSAIKQYTSRKEHAKDVNQQLDEIKHFIVDMSGALPELQESLSQGADKPQVRFGGPRSGKGGRAAREKPRTVFAPSSRSLSRTKPLPTARAPAASPSTIFSSASVP